MQLKTLTCKISKFQDRRSWSSTNNGSISVINQWSRDGVLVGGRQTMQPAQHGLFGLCCAGAWSANNFLFSWSNQRVYQASKKSIFPHIGQIVDWSDGCRASLLTLVKLSFFVLRHESQLSSQLRACVSNSPVQVYVQSEWRGPWRRSWPGEGWEGARSGGSHTASSATSRLLPAGRWFGWCLRWGARTICWNIWNRAPAAPHSQLHS